MRRRTVKTVAGFGASLAIVAAFLHVVGVGKILFAVERADPVLLAAGVGMSLLATVFRVQGWLTVVRGETTLATRDAIPVWFSLQFANNITPFGQAGGEPVIAYLFSKQTDMKTDRGFATVLTADMLNAVPLFTLPLAGAAIYLSFFSLTTPVATLLRTLLPSFLVFVTAVLLLWRLQDRVLHALHWSGDTLHHTLSLLGVQHIGPLEKLRGPTLSRVGDRIFTVFSGYADDRRRIGIAVLYAHLSDLAWILSTYLFLLALGATPYYSALLFIMPIASLANFLPLPGGLGGVEVAMTSSLVAVLGTPLPVASAAVLLLRLSNYWLFTMIGGYYTVTTVGIPGR